MAIINELDVRLVTCSHTLDEWTNLSKPIKASPTIPFLGEVCLESVEITNDNIDSPIAGTYTSTPTWREMGFSSGQVAFRIKIGDNVHDYLELPYVQENYLTNDMVKQILIMMDTNARHTIGIVNNSGSTVATYVPYNMYNSVLNNTVSSLKGETDVILLTVNNGIVTISLNDHIAKDMYFGNSTHKLYVYSTDTSSYQEVVGKTDIQTLIGNAITSALDDLDFSDPSASGSGLTFIDTISQTDGQISATKKTVQDGTTSQKGVVQLQNSIDTTITKAATPNAVKDYVDTTVGNLDGSVSDTDTTSSTTVVTSVSETDGIISGTTKNITEGTRIDVTGTNGNIIISHENVTASNTQVDTAIPDNAYLVTRVTTDTTGHVTGVTSRKIDFDVIAPVQSITDGTKIDVTTTGTTVTVGHKSTTRTDTEESSQPTAIITDITTDITGHITNTKYIDPDDLTVGLAKDLDAPVEQINSDMWNHRTTGGSISIGEDAAKIQKIKGNTLVWNQLADMSRVISQTKNGVTLTKNADNSITLSSENSVEERVFFFYYDESASAWHYPAHKYFVNHTGAFVSFIIYKNNSADVGAGTAVVSDLIKSLESSDIITGFAFGVLPGFVGSFTFTPNLIDLTQMFGAGNEPTTVAEFEAMFPEDYYAYNEGELISLNPTGIKSTDEDNNVIDTLDLNFIKSIKDSNNNQLFPNGLLSAGTVYDEITSTKAIKRVGSRAYTSGDESDSTVTTDGTTTHYALATPIEVTFDTPKNLTYTVEDLGTETLLPENTSTNIVTAPFRGDIAYQSNFKDAVKELVRRVNSYKNPVRGTTNTNQTTGELAVYDSDSTVHSSGYTASNATIVSTASGNDKVLPTVEALVNYVQGISSAALHYMGTIPTEASLPVSPNTGDLYIASAQIIADGTGVLPAGTYDTGDFFIWNGTDWDVIQGTVRVSNNNPTLTLNGSTYTVGTIEGTNIQVTTPNLQFSDPTANGETLTVIDSVSQTNGQISATKKSIPSASTTQRGTTLYVSDIHNAIDTDKTATAKQIWDECEKRNVQFVEMESIETLIHSISEAEFISNYAYGVRWTQNSDNVTYVGASDLKSTLPVHNALRACVYRIVPVTGGFDVTETVDDVNYTVHYGARREFLYWLDEDDWSLKSDGTPSVLTGEDMTGIAIWHPKFYGKSFDGITVGSAVVNEVYVSMIQYDETWVEIKEGYIDFAKMQSVATNGVTYAICFGNPDFTVLNPMEDELSLSDLNTWIQTQKNSNTPLTKSLVALNRTTAHQYALNSGAHLMSYDEYKWIFCWLPVIELATENRGGAFFVENNSAFDWADGSTNIVTRASLQTIPAFMYYGLYTANYSAITSVTGWNFIPAGYTNALGTHTGWVKMRLPNSGGTYDSKIVSRWRGFEIQRNIWTNLMGVNPVQTNVTGSCDIYTTKNRALWSNNMPINITDSSSTTHDNIMPWTRRNSETPEYETNTGWSYAGTQAWTGFGKEFDLGSKGEAFYKATGSTKPEYSYGNLNASNPRWFVVGGCVDFASSGGPFYFGSYHPAGRAGGHVGFRCCWNVDEYESILN